MPRYDEQGLAGLKEYSGFIQEAYARELYWPSVEPLYSRIRRSDPEISIVRNIFQSLARSTAVKWELPDNASDADKKAQEFAQTVIEDIEGGEVTFIDTMISSVPFMGWGWWEVLPGYRNLKWKAPGDDEWKSNYNDNRIGIRRLAWRDQSSFYGWDFADNGRLIGMKQWSMPKPPVTLPLKNSLHLTFGDAHNPEGLSPLEAVWRLERIKYGLEVIQGIGFEHAAGYLNVIANSTLTDNDKAEIKTAARAIMTAQEGNYAAWPKNVTGEVKDIPFTAAPSILEAIKYYGILKLTIFNMQWTALSATSGSGSFAAMNDSSSMFVMTFNAMLEGFAKQIDNQLGKRLFSWNQFPGMTKRPEFKFDPINKISLSDLATILAPLSSVIDLGDEDKIAIRKQTGFLPETLPETAEPQSDISEEPAAEDETDTGEAGNQAEIVSESLDRWHAWTREHDKAMFATLEQRYRK